MSVQYFISGTESAVLNQVLYTLRQSFKSEIPDLDMWTLNDIYTNH